MDAVTMRHPALPESQTIEVAEQSVPHHKQAGWKVVDNDPAPAEETKPTAKKAAQKGSEG